MKASSNPISPLASRSLQLVGLVMIVSFIIDILIIAIPPNLLSPQWRLNFTSQLIDRGVIPLVGVALLLGGIWIKDSEGTSGSKQGMLRSAAVLVSLILGIVYLLVVPLHSIDTVRSRNRALRNLDAQAQQAEQQLQDQLENPEFQAGLDQRREQFRTQINTLISNEEQFQQAIEQAPEGQAELLQQFKDDPSAIDSFIDQQVTALPQRARTQIEEEKMQREERAQVTTVKSISQSMNGALLAVGYLGVGLTGVQLGGGGRKKRRR
ncbi:MAG: HpsJ family protein [Roseofilum sp. SBFL]|uniref:hormogonium polysaccharide biosynthesis protein HpsJ n=1 Tax=unclassified Roseofilum TaxID=2620099 RepID=UPI001B1BF0BF|nr:MULTISPECIES: HpsJ family protein [unclassified Roseofilum]MBP0014011.1 HpsJ family protein [Roseofilum sp. SID3]MBP0024364.1 HpsJ family protein [Roseofilum sp. SID2]MBP0037820.1 HpsJ family protein [Roseofilum sp. SID1]MBP0044906.1 HpsJ family protein [Roseofilum sp. SBFL]